MMQLFISPGSDKFLSTVKVGKHQGVPTAVEAMEKKGVHMNGKPNNCLDSVSSLVFSENLGIVITFYFGNFKLYDAFYF